MCKVDSSYMCIDPTCNRVSCELILRERHSFIHNYSTVPVNDSLRKSHSNWDSLKDFIVQQSKQIFQRAKLESSLTHKRER